MQQKFGGGHAGSVALESHLNCRSGASSGCRAPSRALLSFVCAALFAIWAQSATANNVSGAWLSPAADNWPFVALHAVLTPDGRVLTYGSNSSGQATGLFSYDVWDPAAGLSGGHVTLPNLTSTDTFCSYAVLLPTTGDILIAGGDLWDGTAIQKRGNNNSNIFQSSDATLTRAEDMQRPRWYATVTPLMNGEMYVQGGKDGEDIAELRDVGGIFHALTGFSTSGLDWWYPRNFLAPDGRVFGFDVDGSMYYVSTDGSGSMVPLGQLGSTNTAKVSTAVMFRPGKILQVAGKNRNALVIDINGAQPVVTTTKSLKAKRVWASSTVLPDGKVLVTGGSGADDQLVGVTNYAEIWDPQTGNWTVGASGSRPRLYHSFALLLPDASVLVGGGGASSEAPLNNLHSEIYYPPYLYSASGGFASRPSIVSAPDVIAAGQSFSMEASTNTIQRVTLIQAGSATHGINLQQRFVELSFTKVENILSVNMPTRATDVPPGYYLLFVINGSGVPSVAKIVRINIAGSSGGQDTIAPTTPQNVVISKVGGNPKLVWDASSDAVGVAGYSIYRSTSNTLGTEIALVNNTTFTDTNVVEGTKYWYGIKAYDAAGNLSGASTLRSTTASQSPTTPGNFKVVLSSGDPKLTFSASTDNVGVVGYDVYRSTDGTFGPLFAQIAGSPWTDTSAVAGVTYTYAVRARDAAGYQSTETALKSITAQ